MIFDDTRVKPLVEDFMIAVDELPEGQLVYAFTERGDYESGVIVNVEKYVTYYYCIVKSVCFRKARCHSGRKFSISCFSASPSSSSTGAVSLGRT